MSADLLVTIASSVAVIGVGWGAMVSKLNGIAQRTDTISDKLDTLIKDNSDEHRALGERMARVEALQERGT